jgi:hypothetical protein
MLHANDVRVNQSLQAKEEYWKEQFKGVVESECKQKKESA